MGIGFKKTGIGTSLGVRPSVDPTSEERQQRQAELEAERRRAEHEQRVEAARQASRAAAARGRFGDGT